MPRDYQGERRTELARLARDAFGSDEGAAHWLYGWSPFLGGIPWEMTGTEDEYQAVKDELVRIEFGDFT